MIVGHERMPLAPRNANTMWMMHFLFHLKEGGVAGFVMATGELSSSEIARLEVRKALVDHDYVDCIVWLPSQLFANTPIPCSLWLLSKSRDGSCGFRSRKSEILFIDANGLGALIPGSRKQKQLSDEEIEKIASTYRKFCLESVPDEVSGFCRVATIEEVRNHGYVLTPMRYVGIPESEEDDESFEEKMERLRTRLLEQFDESARLTGIIRSNLKGLGYE